MRILFLILCTILPAVTAAVDPRYCEKGACDSSDKRFVCPDGSPCFENGSQSLFSVGAEDTGNTPQRRVARYAHANRRDLEVRVVLAVSANLFVAIVLVWIYHFKKGGKICGSRSNILHSVQPEPEVPIFEFSNKRGKFVHWIDENDDVERYSQNPVNENAVYDDSEDGYATIELSAPSPPDTPPPSPSMLV